MLQCDRAGRPRAAGRPSIHQLADFAESRGRRRPNVVLVPRPIRKRGLQGPFWMDKSRHLLKNLVACDPPKCLTQATRRYQAPFRLSKSKGSDRSLLPVAAKMAFETAGATGGTPGSPTPVGASFEGMM